MVSRSFLCDSTVTSVVVILTFVKNGIRKRPPKRSWGDGFDTDGKQVRFGTEYDIITLTTPIQLFHGGDLMDNWGEELSKLNDRQLANFAVKFQIEQLKLLAEVKETLNQINDLLEEIDSKLGQD